MRRTELRTNFAVDEQRRRRPNVVKVCSRSVGFGGMDRVGLSEVSGQRIAGVSRTGLSSEAERGSDGRASCYYVTMGDCFEHPSQCH